jgi:hypothetical protein
MSPKHSLTADARARRHLRALLEDMVGVGFALRLGLDEVEEHGLIGDGAEAFGDVRRCARVFARVLEVAQYVAEEEARQVSTGAEGWLRLAVARARGDGIGIRVSGFETELRVAGSSADIPRVLEDLLSGLAATLPPRGFVDIELAGEGVDVSAPIDGSALDPRVDAAVLAAGRAGWAASLEVDGGRAIVRLRDEPEASSDRGPIVHA